MNFISEAQYNNLIKGIGLTYISPSNVSYSTLYGDQSGSNMAVSSSTSGYERNLKSKTLVGTINCKLYNVNNPSDVIVLTNGTYKLVFVEFD